MTTILLILLPSLALVAWACFRFAPIHASRRALLRFNLLSVTIALLLAAAWSVRTYLAMSPTVDSAWSFAGVPRCLDNEPTVARPDLSRENFASSVTELHPRVPLFNRGLRVGPLT